MTACIVSTFCKKFGEFHTNMKIRKLVKEQKLPVTQKFVRPISNTD